jgi:hypothetical protein
MSEAEYVTLQANERSEAIGRSTAAATRARRRKPSFVAVTHTLALAVLTRGASANTPVARAHTPAARRRGVRGRRRHPPGANLQVERRRRPRAHDREEQEQEHEGHGRT